MAEAVFQELNTYVSRRQNTVAQFIATRPMIDLCLATKRRLGSRLSKQWYDQDILYLEGMKVAAQEEERT